MLASVLAIGFVFLINRNDLDMSVAVEAAVATFVTLGIVHSARVPWLLVQRISEKENSLSRVWGILGIFFFCAFLFCVLYAGAWFYTMQPKVVIEARIPDGRDKRIAELQAETAGLRVRIPDDRSLKTRSLQAADEFERFWKRQPKEPTCNQAGLTPAQQQEAIKPCADYYNKRTFLYQQALAPKIMAIVAEFKGKGASVMNIENCASTAFCGIPIAVQLRALSEQLTAQDDLKN